MKKVYVCIAVFALLSGFAIFCDMFVSSKVGEIVANLEQEQFEEAREQWHALIKYSNFIMVDLTLVSDVSVSLTREEKNVAVLLLKHFLSDNLDN
ncbi:MAG: hypothetical protein FWD35_02265 [Oscillospiraceae bacterium]|nr:hypothetical protein [Oscillospiraceae bacterium]